jgi:hypothetical protein
LLQGFANAVRLGSESLGTQDHIFLSQFLRLPQPGGSGPHIYIPQEQSGPVMPPGTGFPFCRLLRLAGLRWKYSNPPPHGLDPTCSSKMSVKFYRTASPYKPGASNLMATALKIYIST